MSPGRSTAGLRSRRPGRSRGRRRRPGRTRAGARREGRGSAVRCPFCHNPDSRVIDSREADEGATTRRRRSCPACGRRFTTVEEAQLQQLAQQVEDAIRATGAAEVPSHEVGLAILRPLRELDEVAYLRFASVYRAFSSLEDFEKEISELRARARPRPPPPGGAPRPRK